MRKPNHFIKTLREGILNFEEGGSNEPRASDGIGKWRLTSKSINFPSNKYIFKYKDLIDSRAPAYLGLGMCRAGSSLSLCLSVSLSLSLSLRLGGAYIEQS